MADASKNDSSSRPRAIVLPWAARRRKNLRTDSTPASPRPTSRRLLTLFASGVVAIGVVVAAVWLAILYMPLPASQVIPRVKAAIQARVGSDYAVDIADAEIHRGDGGVELRLVDLAISKANGGPVVASVPRAELRLNGLGLLGGEVEVRSVHVTRPRLDMRFDTTVDAASKNSDLPARILSAVQDLDRLLGVDGAAGALEDVEVTGATLLVAPSSRAPLSLDGVDLRLSRGAGGAIALTASSARPDDRWTTAVTVTAPNKDNARVIDLGLENLSLAPYSAPFAEKAGAPPVTGRISGHFSARIASDGTMLAGDGRAEARALDFTIPGAAPEEAPNAREIAIDRIQLDMRWDPEARAVRIQPSQIRSKGAQLNFTSALIAPADPGKPWTAQFEGTDVLLSGESSGDPPLRLDRIDAEATFDPTAGVLEIGKAQFIGPTAKAALSGLIRFEGASPAVRLGLVSSPMPASAVKRLWPFFLASSTRSWVVENVSAGQVEKVSLTIDLPSGALADLKPHQPFPEGSVALEVVFTDGVLRGRPGMPWIENANGRVEATARKVDVVIDQAYVSGASDDGPLAVSNVRMSVPDLAPRYPPAELDLNVDGSLKRALTLLQSGAFGGNPVPAQLDVTKVAGKVTAGVKAGFELAHTGDAPPPTVSANADMKDVRIAGIFAGRNFEKGTLQLKVADGLATMTGKGAVGGAPATILVSDEPATATTPARRKLAATVTADAADLTRLGLDVPGTLKGAIPLTAEMILDQPNLAMAVKADLTNVGIDGLVPGFVKPAGRAGRLSFVVDHAADKTTIRDFALESGDRSVRGSVEFGPKGDLVSASLPIYRPGPGDDAKVEIDKARGGVTRIAVQGAALDLKPLVDKVRGKGAAGAKQQGASAGDSSAVPKNLDITAKLGTGLGYGSEAVAGLDLKLTVRDGKVTDAGGSGRIGDGAIKLATGENGRLRLTGGDAGAFFRFADLYGRIDGGTFDLAASLAGGPGEMRMRDFAVRNETALDRARKATNADRGAPAQTTSAGAMRFDRLKVSFVQSTGELAVREAVVYGPQLGATLEGTVNYGANKVDLVGTFVPIYALNNLFGRVPIIGELLGGKNGGLVGVTFQVRGPTSSPTVTVNPLSLVAPGFFRKIFEFRQGGKPAAGEQGAAPADGTAEPASPPQQ